LAARAVAAGGVAATGTLSYVLLDRTPHWLPWLRIAVLALTVAATAGILAAPALRHLGRGAVAGLLAVTAAATLAGPLAYTVDTIGTAHTGSLPSAGPTVASATFGGGAGPGGAGGSAFPGGRASGALGRPTGSGATGGFPGRPPTGTSGRSGTFGRGGVPTGGFPGAGSTVRSAGAGAGGAGGPGGGTVDKALAKLLGTDAGKYRWAAVTFGSQEAAILELATGGDAVMSIGGFNGEDGNLTLAQFEAYVNAGDIHWFVDSGGAGGGPGGGSTNHDQAITTWVESHFKAVTVGGQTVYDLSDRR
jgi:hypothetical protein